MDGANQETELNILGKDIEEIRKILLPTRDILKKKRDYLFGGVPENAAGEKTCGKEPGMIGDLKSSLGFCIHLAQEIRVLSVDIARL